MHCRLGSGCTLEILQGSFGCHISRYSLVSFREQMQHCSMKRLSESPPATCRTIGEHPKKRSQASRLRRDKNGGQQLVTTNPDNFIRTSKAPWIDVSRTLADLRNPTFASFLDLARWTCAWIVFLGHLRNPLFFGFESVAAADRGFLVTVWFFVTGWFGEAVIVFFVLSGYLVGASACAKASLGRFSARDYAIDRASRIFLPFIPALLLTALCDGAGMTFFSDLGFYSGAHPMIHEKVHSAPFASYFTLETFGLNLAMLQTIVAPAFGSNQPLWTISLEFWFYVTFGVALAGVVAAKPAQRWVG